MSEITTEWCDKNSSPSWPTGDYKTYPENYTIELPKEQIHKLEDVVKEENDGS